MFKFMRGAYKPPTVETVLDYSGDEMPAAPRRKRSKEREQAHRERRKEGESRSAVSTRSSKSSHSSSRGGVIEDDAEKERRRKERRERKNRDCSSSVSSSSASTSRVSRRTGSLVVKLSDLEPMTPIQVQPAAAAVSNAVAGRKRSPTMPTTLPTMRSLASEERERAQTPRPIREQRSDPTLKVTTTKVEKPFAEPVIAAPVLPASKPVHAVVPAPAGPVARARTASPGFGRLFPPPSLPTHGIATPPHTPGSKTPMPVLEVAQQLPPTPAAEDDLAKHSEALTSALVRRPHRPHIRTGSEVRFASPATEGTRTPRSGWKPPQHRHHSEGYEQGYFPPHQSLSREQYYRQEINGGSRHKGELPPPPDYLYWQRPQSAVGYYHQQGYYPQNYSPPASHGQSKPVGPPSPPESAKSLPSSLEREGSTRSSSAKPVRHSLPPPPLSQHDYYAYYQYHVFTPQSQAAPQVAHVPRYPPPPPTAGDIEFLPLESKRERKRRHSMHYPSSYEPQHIPHHHHSRVMTPVEGISPTSRPFHDFPPAGSNLKRLVPSKLTVVTNPHGNDSHRLPSPPEFTPGGSRDVFQFMDGGGKMDGDNETTVTSMIAVSSGYPTRDRRPPMQRFVRKRVPEKEVGDAAVPVDEINEGSMAGERMERGESVASGVPLPPPVVPKGELDEAENVRPVLLPPADFCEDVAVFEEEEEDEEDDALKEREVEEELPLVLEDKVVQVEVVADLSLPDATEEEVEEELEEEEEAEEEEAGEQEGFEHSEEAEEDDDAVDQEEEYEDDQEEQEEEEEDCDTVVGLNFEEQEAEAEHTRMETVMEGEGVSVIIGRLETLEECHDEEEEEDGEEQDGSEDEHEDEDNEADEEEEEEEEEDEEEADIHLEQHHQPPGSSLSDTDLGVTLDPDHDEHDQTAEGFLANLANSSPPASSIFSTHSDTTTVITLDSMFPSTTTSSVSSAPSTLSTLTSTDYSSGSSSASYTPQYMHPGVFAYAPSPPPSTVTSSSAGYTCSENSSVTTQYPIRGHHDHNPMTPPRSTPGTRTTSPLMYKRTPFISDPRMGMGIPPLMTEPQAFPRFTSLNLRLLRHLEGELVELERMLGEVEVQLEAGGHAPVYTDSPTGSVRSKLGSGSSASTSSSSSSSLSLELEGKRAEIMDALVWKLGQYNQALVNYQTMMDTFGPVIDPCSPTMTAATSPRRPASRDSGVASSRCSSAGVRLSSTEPATTGFGCHEEKQAYDHIPGGWTDQHHQPAHEETDEGFPKSQIPGEAEEEEQVREDPRTEESILLQDTIIPGKRCIHKPPSKNRSRHGSTRSPPSSAFTSPHMHSPHPNTRTTPPAAPQKEVTLTDILAPPVLILTVLFSLEWISSWGRILGLMMVFGLGRAWRDGRVKESEMERGRSRGRGRV